MNQERGGFSFAGGRKQKVINIISSLLSFGVGFGVSFFLSPFLLKTLGSAAYSFYPLSTNITNAMTVVSAALNSMGSRFITVALVHDQKEDAKKYFSSMLFVDFLYAAVLLVFAAVFVPLIQVFLNVPSELVTSVRLLFAFTISASAVNIISSTFGVAAFATNHVELTSIREIGASLLRAALFVLLYWLLPSNLSFIGVVALILAVANLIVQMVYTKKLLPFLSFRRKDISKKHFKDIFTASLWIMLHSIGNTLLASMTLVVVNRFYGPESGSLVSLSMTVSTLISGAITAIIGAYFPVITKSYADGDYPKMQAQIRKSQILNGVFGCAVLSVFLAFSKSFFALWVPTEDAVALSDFAFYTSLPYWVTPFFWIATYVNTATNDVKIPAIVMASTGLASLLLQILLSFLGVPLMWVVLSCSILQVLLIAGFMPVYLAKTTKAPWHYYYHEPIKILALTVLSYVFARAAASLFTINSWAKFFLFGGGTGILSLLLYGLGLTIMGKGWLKNLWQIKG